MQASQLKELLQARKPIILHLVSGRTVIVKHTDYALFTPDGKTVAIAVSDDAFEIIRVDAIESVTSTAA